MTLPPPPPEHNHKRNRAVLITTVIFLFLGACWFGYYWFWGRFYQNTNDAYVDGNNIVVTPQISGIVQALGVMNADFVPQGKVLLELDRTDATIALDRSLADLAEAVREVMHLFETAKQYEAMIALKKAEFVKAAQDYEHRKNLIDEGGVSLEDFEHAEAALKSSFADLVAAEHKYIATFSQIENTTVVTHPKVELAKSRVRDSFVFYQRCTIKAPATGVVAMRTVQVGQQVHVGKPLLAIVPLDQMWVNANFKEVQLSKMRVGQKVRVLSDIYGREVVYQGTVAGIGGGTGSVFSVLPPQNATGNWIKIVQRIPVRILLDQEQVKQHPLRLGLSMDVTVDIHDTTLPRLPEIRENHPLFTTDVFENQEDGVDALIDRVIVENLSQMFLKDNEE